MHDSHHTVAKEGRPARQVAECKPHAVREPAPDGDPISHDERMACQAGLACTRAELVASECRQQLAHALRVPMMGELAASIAHELSQPLTSVLVNAQAAERFLALDPPRIDEVRMILRDIIEDDRRAGEVIRRLWSMVKSEIVEPLDVDLNRTVADVHKFVGYDAGLRGVTLESRLAPGLPSVQGDRIQLQQVVLNLVINGMDAMKEVPAGERRLSVRTVEGDQRLVRLEVSDRGVGIDDRMLDQIFEPYVTTKRDGLGMGLSIARSIVEAHGGQLWATNNPGRGATFSFTLPAKKGHGDG